MKTQILGLGGTTSPTSTSRRALEHALSGAAEAGAATTLLDLAELPLPLFRPDVAPNEAVAALIAAVRGADGFLWSSPLYHGSVSAQPPSGPPRSRAPKSVKATGSFPLRGSRS